MADGGRSASALREYAQPDNMRFSAGQFVPHNLKNYLIYPQYEMNAIKHAFTTAPKYT
jgi:hypothetical protein